MKKIKFRVKKITIVSLILVLILIGGGIFTFLRINKARIEASGEIDNIFYKKCVQKKVLPKDVTKIPQYLEQKYKKKYPDTKSKKLTLDFDTYAESWNDYPEGKDIGQKTRLNFKNLAPQVISEIQNIYGTPYQNNKVVVVYDSNFENNFNLNEYRLNSISGQYRPDLKLIVYSGDSGVLSKKNFIHEIIHTFNDLAIPIDAYEEGLTESAAQIVAAKFGETAPIVLKPTINRSILASPAGLFRTLNNSELVSDRYSAAAAFFQKKYAQNPQFFKDFRNRLTKLPQFQDMLRDPQSLMKSVVYDGACAELTDKSDKNKLTSYLDLLENTLVSGLSGKKVNDLASSPPYNAVIDISPPSNLYPDVSYNVSSGNIDIMATYKRSEINEVVLRLYHDNYGESANDISFENLENLFQNVSISTNPQDLAYLLEEPADSVNFSVYLTGAGRKRKVFSSNFTQADSLTDGTFHTYNLKELLRLASLKPDYTGNLTLNVTARKKVYKAERRNKCIKWPGGQICWPDGLRSIPKDVEVSGGNTISVKQGRIVAPAR